MRVDGMHGRGVPMHDLRNALRVASPAATMIADDCTGRFPEVPQAWWALVDEGEIVHEAHRALELPPPTGRKGWCIGAAATRSTSRQSSPRLTCIDIC